MSLSIEREDMGRWRVNGPAMLDLDGVAELLRECRRVLEENGRVTTVASFRERYMPPCPECGQKPGKRAETVKQDFCDHPWHDLNEVAA